MTRASIPVVALALFACIALGGYFASLAFARRDEDASATPLVSAAAAWAVKRSATSSQVCGVLQSPNILLGHFKLISFLPKRASIAIPLRTPVFVTSY